MSTANKNYPLIKETDSTGQPLNAYDQLVTEGNNFRRAVDKDINELEQKVITESGSNENGRYIKFGDGTQICFGTIPYSGSLTRTFPADFSAVPHVVTDIIGPNDVAMLSKVYSRTTSSFTIRKFQFAEGTWLPAKEQASWIAIGRWK